MTRRMRIAVTAWPWVLAAVVLAPLMAPGYVLSYDMVFVPDLALRSDFLGLGSGLPRAVPSDAVVAVLDEVVPGMVLQKIVLVAAVVLAGMGARRLVPVDAGVAQLAATSLYVWNPFVAERLGIGHWPLLLAYAALPWIFDTGRRARAGEQQALPQLVLWLALAALSAAGGLMAAVVALAAVVGRGSAAVRRTALVVAAALAVNAPWLVAGALHEGGAVSDPAGVEAFAARGEGPLPMPLTALGLGGIWNAEVVPVSREGWIAVFALVATLAVCGAGSRRWCRQLQRRDRWALAVLGALGLGIALVGMVAAGAMEWFVASVPGGGLLRDGSRFLALLAPLEASLFGVGAATLASAVRERVASVALAAGAVLLPLAVMPDLAWGLAGALRPVDFPQEYAETRARLAERAEQVDGGDLLVLPFTSYRVPSWNHGRRTLDPVGRYMPVNFLASDVLYVSGRPVAGEDARAAAVQRMLVGGRSGELAEALRDEGIGWIVLDKEAREALPTRLRSPLPSHVLDLHDGQLLYLGELDRPVERSRPPSTAIVLGAWLLAAGSIGACALRAVRVISRRPGGKRAADP